MTPTVWIEPVLCPNVVWPNGTTLEPFKPIEVTRPLRFGPSGSDADLLWSEPHELELSPAPGGLLSKQTPGSATGNLLRVGMTWDSPPLLLRVIGAENDSAAWPADLRRPPGPWTDETLSVLGDQLLERGRTVGQRFIARAAGDDGSWLPIVSGPRRLDAIVGWHRGVVHALQLSGSPSSGFGRALVMQAVCAPLRQLELTFRPFSDYDSLVVGLIAGGGLPCLERLRFAVDMRAPMDATPSPELAARLRKLPGFGAAFPALQTFEVEHIAPLNPSLRPHPVVG